MRKKGLEKSINTSKELHCIFFHQRYIDTLCGKTKTFRFAESAVLDETEKDYRN